MIRLFGKYFFVKSDELIRRPDTKKNIELLRKYTAQRKKEEGIPWYFRVVVRPAIEEALKTAESAAVATTEVDDSAGNQSEPD